MKQVEIEGGATLWARKVVDSEIFFNKPSDWFKIWFYLVSRVNFKTDKRFERGEIFLNYEWIADATNTTRDQVKHCIEYLKEALMIATRKTTRGIIIKVLNYDKYQTLDNYYYGVESLTESPTKARQKPDESPTILKNVKNEKNVKNVLQYSEPSSQVKTIMDIFYKINPTLNFGNKTIRSSAEWMLQRWGLPDTIRIAEYACSVQGQQFAPVITTPYQLKEKIAQLKIYKEKQENNSNIKIGSIT